MPLLYSINGKPGAYERVQTISPGAPAREVFSKILTGQLTKEQISSEHLTQHKLRGYAEETHELQRKQVLCAEELMSKAPKCVFESARLEEAVELMKQHQFRHLPVLTSDRRLCGILSDRDLLRAGESKSQELVRIHMSTQVLTATPETPIQQIAEAMLANKIHGLPIVDAEHCVIGILTTTDILRAIVQNAPLELWA